MTSSLTLGSNQRLDIRDAQRLSLLHPHIGLGRLGAKFRRLLLVHRISDNAARNRPCRRADQRAGAAVTRAADGRTHERTRSGADERAGAGVVWFTIGILATCQQHRRCRCH